MLYGRQLNFEAPLNKMAVEAVGVKVFGVGFVGFVRLFCCVDTCVFIFKSTTSMHCTATMCETLMQS